MKGNKPWKGVGEVKEMLDMTIKINCKNDKETEIIKREFNRFIRRVKHIRNKEFNYEISIVNLESGKIKTSINKRKPREINL